MGETGHQRFTVTTTLAIPAAVDALRESLGRRGFSVLWELDVNAKLEEKGLSLALPYRILEVCSAPRAKQAIEANPEIGYYLPCKVVVYEHDGTTHLGMPRPEALLEQLGDTRLTDFASEVGQVLTAALDEVSRLG